jgi:hypothetical protein
MKEAAKTQTKANDTNYRWLENLHIVLWLLKDTCWALLWKPGGLIMIAPTVVVAFYILWRSRNNITDFFHNIAVALWICGNSLWMAGEFFTIDFRAYSVTLFIIGLATLVFYYLVLHKKERPL